METRRIKLGQSRRAMSSFEVIGYAILTIVVIIVCVIIFTKLTKGPTDSIGGITTATDTSVQDCKNNPSTCNPLAKLEAVSAGYNEQQVVWKL